jgi:uncharacterized protein (DUF58 family)
VRLRPLVPPAVSVAAGPARRWPFAFAPRFFVLAAAGVVLAAPAWIDRRAIVAMMAWNAIIVAAWILDLRRLPGPRLITVTRSWRAALTIGAANRVDVRVQNEGRVTVRTWLMDETAGSLRRELPEIEVRVPPGGSESGGYDIEPRERGDVAMGVIAVRYRSAWGIAERWATAAAGQTVRVYPDLHEARRQSMYLVRCRQTAIEKRRSRAAGLGRDFESLREYRDGDEPRDICWTATARRAKVVTRVYQPERSQAVWIIVDGGRLLRAQVNRQTKLDVMVNAALALAQVALSAGDRVALLTYGRRIHQRVAPGRGAPHLRAILEALATVPAEATEADHGAAASSVRAGQKQRALVVWLTDLAETAAVPDVIDHASRLSPQHVVVFAVMRQPEITALAEAAPDSADQMYRVMAAQETVDRRDVLLRGLRHRGVLAMELDPGDLTATLVDRYLSVKERNLV